MAKCRMLLQENEDLGRSMSSGRIAKLEGDIALQKRLIDEMKNSEKGRLVFSLARLSLWLSRPSYICCPPYNLYCVGGDIKHCTMPTSDLG